MHLHDLVETSIKYDTSKIVVDRELSSEIPPLPIGQGILTPTVEDIFGPVSIAALKRFQKLNRCYEPGFLGKRTATELLEVDKVATRGGESVPSIQVQIIQDTLLKTKPLQSDALLPAEKQKLKAGVTLQVASFEVERGNLKITLAGTPVENTCTAYIFGEHAAVLKGSTRISPKRDEIKLPVPYKSQRDNEINRDGSCKVTSIAMYLEALNIPRRHSEKPFEDELYNSALERGLERHVGAHLAQIVRDYRTKDNYSETATIEKIKDWLASSNPAVVHSYFTQSGHKIALVGYDSAGFIVHDPYGEWFADGYDRNEPDGNDKKGKFLHYSYGMIKDTCLPDGAFWVHFISP